MSGDRDIKRDSRREKDKHRETLWETETQKEKDAELKGGDRHNALP